MRDIRDDILPLWQELTRLPSTSGKARAVQFISPSAGSGTTSVAASFAMLVAARVQRTAWLVDLDMRRAMAWRGFEGGAFRKAGLPGQAYDASLGATPIYSVTAPAPGPSRGKGKAEAGERQGRFLVAHRVGDTRLLVTRLRTERLGQGQKVRLVDSPAWWAALRKATDWIVVDSPSIDRTPAGLAVSRLMDGVVIVADAERTRTGEIASLRRNIEAAGGTVLGVIMNGARSDARLIGRVFR